MRTWKRPVATIVAITVAIELLLVVSRSGPAVLLIAALCGLIGVVMWFIADLAEVVLDSSDVDVEPSTLELAGQTDRRVMRLRSGLAYTRDDESLERLRASLVELVDDQLQAVYHIDRAADPAAASAVLGAGSERLRRRPARGQSARSAEPGRSGTDAHRTDLIRRPQWNDWARNDSNSTTCRGWPGRCSTRSRVAVVGKRRALTLVLAAILAGGHVLLEDFPGLGKTLAARSFAQTLGLNFARAQFTPDLLPSDLTGSFVYDQRSSDFSFRRGPLFAGLLLADEINRTPPRTQSALLEAMQERQITVEGETFVLEPPFHVLATANPIEYEGTYPLPEAQLDRFMMRTSFGYPSGDEEWDVLRRRMDRRREEQSLQSDHGRVDVARDAGGGRTCDGRRERGSLLRRPGDGDTCASPRADGSVTARIARAPPRGAGLRGHRRS